MNEVYLIEDLFNTLIALEVYGVEMYTKLSKNTDDMEAFRLFEKLAQQEEEHMKLYRTLQKKYSSSEPVDSEYRKYLQALIKNSFFKEVDYSSITDLRQALDLAIKLEKETILFLQETHSLLDSSAKETLDEVINEEKRHLAMLYNFKDEKEIK